MKDSQRKAYWSKQQLSNIVDFRDFNTDNKGAFGIAVDREDAESTKETLIDNRFKHVKIIHADDHTSVLRFKQ